MSNLSEAKVGDKLAVRGSWNQFYILTVDRVTKTLVICGDRKFNMNGRVPGEGGYSFTLAKIATEADFLRVRLIKATEKLAQFKITEHNIDAVEALLEGE